MDADDLRLSASNRDIRGKACGGLPGSGTPPYTSTYRERLGEFGRITVGGGSLTRAGE
jgi:hypothetical protein